MGFESNLPAMKKAIERQQEVILESIGSFIDGDAVRRCPKREHGGGNLQNSIKYVVDKRKKLVTVGTPVEYAIWVEKGTGEFASNGMGRKGGWFYVDDMGIGHFTLGMKPQPFLTPALEENLGKIKKIAKGVKFKHGIT